MHLIVDNGRGHLSLVEPDSDNIPSYAILSHTWGRHGDEVTMKDLLEGTSKNKASYNKIDFCRTQAASDEVQFFWVDTCYINKASNAKLSEYYD
jgi:hypothetical protein